MGFFVVNSAITLFCLSACLGHKPVILMIGFLPSPDTFFDFQENIERVHPGTNVTLISTYDDKVSSLTPMWKQTEAAIDVIRRVSKQSKDGFHLLCFSQGGLVCRAALQTIPNHNCDTFISLSSPQAGQYGVTAEFGKFLPSIFTPELYIFFYSEIGQLISVGNYWNDPHHQKLYRQKSVFLSVINGPTFSEYYRKNFLRTKKLVLIGGPDDGVITPWQSSQFAFYNTKEKVLPMEQQKFFINDTFGLKTMAKQGRIHKITVPGVEHTHWHKNSSVFDKFIAPWLT